MKFHLGIIVLMFIFFVLSTNIFFHHLLIESDGSDKVSSCPEGFLCDRFFVGECVVQHNGTLSLEESHHICHAEAGWDFEYHVNVVRFGSAFDHLNILLSQKFSDDQSCALPYLAIELFLSVFGHDDDVVDAIPFHVRL